MKVKQGMVLTLMLLAASFGCTLPFKIKSSATTFFIVQDWRAEPKQLVKIEQPLFVNHTGSPQYLNSRRIIFTDDPLRRSFYQFSFWAEPPPDRFTFLLRRRLERVFGESAVVTNPAISAPQLRLDTELLEFVHDTSSRPGTARVVVSAELVTIADGTRLAKETFNRTVEVSDYDAEGAVGALSEAVTAVLDDLVAWLTRELGTGG